MDARWATRVVGVLLCCGAAIPAVAGPPLRLAEGERARMAAALEALRDGDWFRAARGFGDAAQRGGLLADYARFFQAEALARQGALTAARRAAEGLRDRYPESPLAPTALVEASVWASRQADESAAESPLRRFLAEFPTHPDAPAARYLLGLCLEAQGRRDEMAQIFRELWLTAPASPYGEAAGGRLSAPAFIGVAVPSLTQSERMDRAERLVAGGLLADARQEAEALLAELPGPELTLRALRVMSASARHGSLPQVAQRATDGALAAADPALRAALLLELARVEQHAGARKVALATLDRLIREDPGAPEVADALLQSGRLLEEAGRPGDAEVPYQRLVADFAGGDAAAAALWRLAWLAYTRADLQAAAAEFGRLSALPAGGLYRQPATYWAGRALEALGERDEAGRLYDSLVSEAPRGYYGILASGRTGARPVPRGRPIAAALPRDPLRPLADDPRYARAEALRTLGLVEFAVGELEEIQSTSFTDAPKLYALGAAFVREERYHLALRIFRRFFADVAASGDPALPRQFWEMFYPLAWSRELAEAAAQAGVDRFLLLALVREESSFFPAARSRAGARGLMQLMPDTARGLARRRGLAFAGGDLLDDPGSNLRVGAAYLASLLAEFPDPRLAAAAYNAGPARVHEWWAARPNDDLEQFVERIPFDETRHFVKRVMVSWQEYRRIYGGEAQAQEARGGDR